MKCTIIDNKTDQVIIIYDRGLSFFPLYSANNETLATLTILNLTPIKGKHGLLTYLTILNLTPIKGKHGLLTYSVKMEGMDTQSCVNYAYTKTSCDFKDTEA